MLLVWSDSGSFVCCWFGVTDSGSLVCWSDSGSLVCGWFGVTVGVWYVGVTVGVWYVAGLE